ncbi:MAG: hypothetical protein K2H83_06360 [Duncaniella sp.]|nr:hypothetical protein [Duncaniella sp.]MDE5734747.1 hypothetical protein [Duncaniella sp.]MDE6179366.1 hypothetical protein [Duncaniella sp.]MDE6390984.1 hypothetical protein [Duncaniella sp.]
MQSLLTNEQAGEMYESLRRIHLSDNGWVDKVNSLRSIFDRLLTLETLTSINARKLPPELGGFQMKIEHLEKVVPGHRERLEPLRQLFNTVQHQTFSNGYQRHVALNRRRYMEILRILVSHVAHVSGVPTMPELSLALSELNDYQNVDERQVVILCQLFRSHMDIAEGTRIVKEFDEFLKRKKEFGLEKVKFTLMTYSLPFTYRTETDAFKLSSQEKDDLAGWTEWALIRALDLLEDNIQMRPGHRPWLVWICSDIPETVDPEIYADIKRWDAENKMVFYPIFTSRKAEEQLGRLFAGHLPKPSKLDPNKADRFFNSIALTLQRASKK